jgi:thiol-disulfide isomerase/thioredoxin
MRYCLLFLAITSAFAQCEPSELRAQIENLPDFQTDTLTYSELVAAHRAFVAAHPGSIPAEQRLIFILSNGWWSQPDREKEFARYRAMKDRQLGEFLEMALRLLYLDTRTLAARFPDLAKRMCNAPIVPIGRLRKAETRADAIPTALEALADRTDNSAVIGWWEVIDAMDELHDPRAHESVAKLRAMNRYGYELWAIYTLRALQLIKDRDGEKALRAELATRRPESRYAIEAILAEWFTTHPRPKDVHEAGFAQYAHDEIIFLRGVLDKHPRSIAAAALYFNAAQDGANPALSRDEALSAVDTMLRYDRDYAFGIFRLDEVPLQVARVYLDRGARLDEVPALASEQLRRTRVEYDMASSSPSQAEFANERLNRNQLHANTLLAEYWFQKKDAAQASRYAELARSNLAIFAPQPNASDSARKLFEYEQARLLKTVKLIGVEAKPLAEPRTIDWDSVPRKPLPEFSVTDLSGRHWDMAALKGKVVFVNLWGTWCIPCRAEMPHIQRLYDEAKSVGDRLVLTVNIDEDVELTRKFLSENGYTFPVIHSTDFADLIDHANGYPQSRLIDPQGRMLQEQADIHCKTCAESIRKVMDGLAAKVR